MKLVALMLAAALVFGCAGPSPKLGAYGSSHEHADFKVYVNDKAVNFSQEKYMSPGVEGVDCGNDTTKLAHLHNMDGGLVHKHARGVTWAYFFSTLNMNLTDSCLVLDNGTGYCNGNGKRWEYSVNGDAVSSIKDLEIHDKDRVLITYGASYEEAVRQYASVTSKASAEGSGNECGPPG